MIIDVHAHVTPPPEVYAYNYNLLVTEGASGRGDLKLSGDSLEASLQEHIRQVREVGTDCQLITLRPLAIPTAGTTETVVRYITQTANDVIARTVKLHPDLFKGVAGLPQCAGVNPGNCLDELERCIEELGFVGCKINPDPGEGDGRTPLMGDEFWFPLYEKMVELDVPGLIHGGGSRFSPEPETDYFITVESMAGLSLLRSGVFKEFPTLKLIVAHGGAALPYQVGRGRARRLADGRGHPEVESFDAALRRLYFDTVLYNQESLELLIKVVGVERCLFGTDRPAFASTVRDPETGRYLDDIRRLVEAVPWLNEADRGLIFEGNALQAFGRLQLAAAG